MENFATLTQRIDELRDQLLQLSKESSGNSRSQKMINIGVQAKAIKARLDKYGTGTVVELLIEVKYKDSLTFQNYKMCFTNISENRQDQWQEMVKYKLETQYKGELIFSKILGHRVFKCGLILVGF